MVHERYPWKQDLRRRKNLLLQYNTVEKFEADEDKAYTVIEKAIFYSAFIIRKLIDCDRHSKQADNWTIKVEKYPAPREFNKIHHSLGENSHDWEKKQIDTVKAHNICNWLIHSFIFSLMTNEDGIAEAFAVASDFDRNEFLYVVSIQDWITYMDFVASDYVVASGYQAERVKKGKKTLVDYVAKYKERGIPEEVGNSNGKRH